MGGVTALLPAPQPLIAACPALAPPQIQALNPLPLIPILGFAGGRVAEPHVVHRGVFVWDLGSCEDTGDPPQHPHFETGALQK